MRRLYHFAGNHPLSFGLLLLLVWFIIAALAVAAFSFVLGLPLANSNVQSAGSLAATAFLLAFAWRFGWLRPTGITSLGAWKIWLASLAALVYMVIVYWQLFFGATGFDFTSIFKHEDAWAVLQRQVVVGIVEEFVFRGLLLYALIRVWGKTKRGLVLGAWYQLFFSAPLISCRDLRAVR